MSYEIVNEFPNDIIFETGDVCISIYQPTFGPKSQAKILFKNQIQKAKRSLEKEYRTKEVEEILKPLYDIENDLNFWNKTKDGIAILMNRKRCIVYNLFRDIKELTVVADSFHIKPLLRVYQSADKYYVLCVNRRTFKLYYGDRYELREMTFSEDVPVNIEDVLGDQYTDAQKTVTRATSPTGIYTHGYGGKREEIELDTEKYLRYVDRFVINNYSNPTQAPLVLVALTENQGLFRKISKNRYLLEQGIRKDFEAITKEEIRKESWQIIEERYLKRTNEMVDKYEEAKAINRGSDDYKDVAEKAVANRIEVVLIESDTLIPGKIDFDTGAVETADLSDPDTGDILDLIAELTLAGGGEVVMLPQERMPSDTGIAAVYRY